MRKININRENRDLRYYPTNNLWFEEEAENLYSIHSDLDYLLEYVCMNYDELPSDSENYDSCYTDQFGKEHKCKNYSFDPAGGPFIAVGNYKIEGKTVTRIFSDGEKTLFKTEHDK